MENKMETGVRSMHAFISHQNDQPNSNLGKHHIESVVPTFFLTILFLLMIASAFAQPSITGFTPGSGPVGTSIAINGTGFSATPSSNIVYFGATKGTVTAASSNQLTVAVPVGATYQPISILANGLLASSSVPFNTTYPGWGIIDANAFITQSTVTTGTSPYWSSVADFDGDGRSDLAIVNYSSSTLSIFRNTSSAIGTFTYATKVDYVAPSNPSTFKVADFDGDGKLDLVVKGVNGGLSSIFSVFRNTSAGPGSISFASKTDVANGFTQVEVADLDGDGRLDMVLTNFNTNTVSVFRNTSSGPGTISFGSNVDFTTGNSPTSISIGDIDGNGKLDLVTTSSSANTISVLLNTTGLAGSISFASKIDLAAGTAPNLVKVGDLDGDGKGDLAFTSSSNLVSVMRNTGTGPGLVSFDAKMDFSAASIGSSLSMGDLDGDGKTDLMLASNSTNAVLSLYRNTSTGVGVIGFAARFDCKALSSASASLGDLDGDGKADIVAPNQLGNTVSVFLHRMGARQTISFGLLPQKTLGDASFLLSGTASSGLSLTYTSSNPAVATISGNTVTLVGIGTATITASQPGDSYYGPAVSVSQVLAVGPFPYVSTFTPLKGQIGASVTINGSGFNATPANNIVYFGAAKATVTAASGSQLTVTVPKGAGFQPISVLANQLQSYSRYPFNTTYPGWGVIDANSYAPKVDFTTGSTPYNVASADFDGDGKADMVTANINSGTFSVFRNTSTKSGMANFTAKTDYTISGSPTFVTTGDVDADGKLDVLVLDAANKVSIFRNTSSGSGVISFATRVDFATGSSPFSFSLGDIDGDGLTDIAISYASNPGTISILRNQSTGPGVVSFSTRVDFAIITNITSNFASIAMGDIDGDAKVDLVIPNPGNNNVSILRNTSVPGSISFASSLEFVTGTTPNSVSIGDFDGDAKLDLVLVNYGANSISTLRNTTSAPGSISFAAKSDYATGTSPKSVSIGDLDGDGKPDIAAPNIGGSNTISVFKNASTGTGSVAFAAKIDYGVGARPYSISIQDFDGDNKADMAVANEGANTVSVLLHKTEQSITFSALPVKTYGDAPFALTATASSGLAITYTSGNSSVATVSGNTITIVGAGSAVITASQAGNTNYTAAANVTQTLTVNKANQTITFAPIAATYGDAPFPLNASASSGLTVSYASSNPAVATVTGGVVTILGAGSSVITASQPGNANYAAALSVPQTLVVSKSSQSITFNPLAASYGDTPLTLTAIASSALPVSYTSSNPSVATVNGNVLTIVAAGTTTIKASQPGNANYLAAADVSQALTVSKGNQLINFGPLPSVYYGNPPFTLTGTASSGLPLSYSSSNPSVALVSGNVITVVGAGVTTIKASQGGNFNYNAAPDVPQNLVVNCNSYNVQGGGLIDLTGTSLPITLSGSDRGVSYQLLRNNIAQGSPIPGTGTSISWTSSEGGIYTVLATGDVCSQVMNGEAALGRQVIWTPQPGVTGSSNIVSGTSDTWVGTYSYNYLPANTDGWIAFTLDFQTWGSRYVLGFADTDAIFDPPRVKKGLYIIQPPGSNAHQVYLNEGSWGGTDLSSWNTGDQVRIARVGNTVHYYRNGVEVASTTMEQAHGFAIKLVMYYGSSPAIMSSFGPQLAISGTISEVPVTGGDGSVSVVVNGGAVPYQYSWSTGEQTPSISNSLGNYTVTASDANGSTASKSFTIGYDVYWTSQPGVTGTKGILSGTPNSWLGSNSYNFLPAGTDGWMEFILDAQVGGCRYVIGFGDKGITFDPTQVKKGIYVFQEANISSQYLMLNEGTWGGTILSNWHHGDVLRIARTGNTVHYYLNGVELASSTMDTSSDYVLKAVLFNGHSPVAALSFLGNIPLQAEDGYQPQALYNGTITAAAWHTQAAYATGKEDYNGLYIYKYDEKYQLLEAQFAVPDFASHTFALAGNNFRETGYSFDPNGNIQTLKRYDSKGGKIHDLTYTYSYELANDPKYNNQLNRVTNQGSAFRDYHYNAIGQMDTQDNATGADQVVDYDVTGKVTDVYADAGKTKKTTHYTYDDRGFRLSKETYDANGTLQFTTWYIRDASGNVLSIYNQQANDTNLTLEETPIYGSGKLGMYRPKSNGGGEFVYELTDHLGNVRATIKNETTVYLATMEDNGSADYTNPRVSEMQYFRNVFETSQHDTRMNHTEGKNCGNCTPANSSYLSWNTNDTNKKAIGVGITLKVEAGDQLNLEAWAKFQHATSYSRDATAAMMAGLLSTTFLGANGLELATTATQDFANAVPLALTGTSSDLPDRPYAYLNYIVFDPNFVAVDGAARRVPQAAGFDPGMEIAVNPQQVSFTNPILIGQTGYVYVWVSNESANTQVWWDDLKVTITGNRVTQATDYYPFGLTMRSQSMSTDPTYRYGYQGQYAEKDDETGWEHFELREYDPVIVRTLVPDPSSQFYSSYLWVGNDPINSVDPDGGTCCGGDRDTQAEYEEAMRLNDENLAFEIRLSGAKLLSQVSVTPDIDKSIVNRWINFNPAFIQDYPLMGMRVADPETGWSLASSYVFGREQFTDPTDGRMYSVNKDGYLDGPGYVTGTVDVNGIGRGLKGAYTVYKAIKNGKIVYWGITKNFAKRVAQHGNRFDDIVPVFQGVSKSVARGIEQIKIESHGLQKLENIINSVGRNNPKLMQYYKDAISYFKTLP
jgi:RHS repeat-associated protein